MHEIARQAYRAFHHYCPLRLGHPLYFPIFMLRGIYSRALVVELNHGLANRLVTLVSCMAASEAMGKEAQFIWSLNRNCGCRFHDLFENSITLVDHKRIIDFNDDTTFRPAFLTSRKTLFYSSYRMRTFEKRGSLDWDIHNIPFISGIVDQAAIDFSRRLNMLQPRQEVCDLVPSFSRSAVGVHVRRTDLPWKSRSPLEAFEKRMGALIAEKPDTQFFLASDSVWVKSYFRDKYGDAVCCSSEPSSRSSAAGLRHALADIIALSQCRIVLGTFNSSFSWLASMWSLQELETVAVDCTLPTKANELS